MAAAIREADTAVGLCPRASELYELRSALWRLSGDYLKASRDVATAVSLDPNVRYASRVQVAVPRLTAWFLLEPGDPPPPANPSTSRLREVLADRADALAQRRAVLDRPACELPCPSQCCYFEEAAHAYGVHVPPAQLEAVRSWLAAEGLEAGAFLGAQPKGDCVAAVADKADWFDDRPPSGPVLWFPRRASRFAPELPPDARPLMKDYRNLPWLTPRARACRFLGDHGCRIHDVGSPPGLPTCRNFLCLTAFVFALLRGLAVCDTGQLAARRIADLHRAAVPLLLALDDAVTKDATLNAGETRTRAALAKAAAADRRGDAVGAATALDDYDGEARTQREAHEDLGRALRQVLNRRFIDGGVQ